jgi:ATP-dependent Clp protease ATP-binding subunit ClpX
LTPDKFGSEREVASVHAQVTADDLIEFGMIPEFVGRLPVLSPLEPLTVSALINILTQPKNAIIKQYQHLFGLEGAGLVYTHGALEEIAARALKRQTGARALRSVMEEFMLPLMFELPDFDCEGVEFTIDEKALAIGRPNLSQLRQTRKKASA